jgi:membrane fusion protein, multidrug efflux system
LLKAKASNMDNQLAMDQHIKARIIWGEKTALRVPLMAVFRVDGQPFVYRAVRKEDKASKSNDLNATMQAVTLGNIVDQDVIVENGLKSGDVIVKKGIQKLQEGSAIAEAH